MLIHSLRRTFLIFYFLLSCLSSQVALAGNAGGEITDANLNAVDNLQTTDTPDSGTPTDNGTSTNDIQIAGAPNSEISTSNTLTTSTVDASNYPNQSAIINQNYGYGSNPLTYPNCTGVCAFGVVRLNPNSNGNVSPEAVMGVVMQFDSPEQRYAQARQNTAKAESDRMIQEDEISLLTKLADAVEQCKDTHANLLALTAAKRLGMTPEALLSRAYQQPRQCNIR
jgi:hypothetical protein